MRIRRFAKRFLVSCALSRAVACRSTRRKTRIFMYHRFRGNHLAKEGALDSKTFGRHLDLITSKFKVITLTELATHLLRHGEPPENCVVITVDDGYRDFYLYAYPQLRERGLPATFFVAFDFVDSGQWLWPDKLAYVLDNATLTGRKEFQTAEGAVSLDFRSAAARHEAFSQLNRICVGLDFAETLRLIDCLSHELNVDIPNTVGEGFEPVTWEELREMQSHRIEIGAHSKTHPILSRITPDQARAEVVGVKARLEEKLGGPVFSYCYPNGRYGDVTQHVVELVKDAGYHCAVLSEGGWDGCGPYRIPRIAAVDDDMIFRWCLYGFEALFSIPGGSVSATVESASTKTRSHVDA